uniref:Uncharacterized protein n=1 Tax=Anguilla anguilla TaxID=7936 RepID=A0A0E9R7H7_ANGAN
MSVYKGFRKLAQTGRSYVEVRNSVKPKH